MRHTYTIDEEAGVLIVDHGWPCCPHQYKLVKGDPYAAPEQSEEVQATPGKEEDAQSASGQQGS